MQLSFPGIFRPKPSASPQTHGVQSFNHQNMIITRRKAVAVPVVMIIAVIISTTNK